MAQIPQCTVVRKQEAFEQEVTQASVWRHAPPTPSSTFIFLFLCTTKDRDMPYTDDHTNTPVIKQSGLSIKTYLGALSRPLSISP